MFSGVDPSVTATCRCLEAKQSQVLDGEPSLQAMDVGTPSSRAYANAWV